jgi:hypothetical protein
MMPVPGSERRPMFCRANYWTISGRNKGYTNVPWMKCSTAMWLSLGKHHGASDVERRRTWRKERKTIDDNSVRDE